MKKLIGLLVIAVFLMFPLYANAGLIGYVSLQEYYSSPTGPVTFPTGSGTYYFDYDVKLDGGALLEAFCVDTQNGPGYGVQKEYALYSIDAFSPEKYRAAAWIAEHYSSQLSNDDAKAAAQIAVWEVIFDWGHLNVLDGTFRANNFYTTAASAILADLPSTFGPSTGWLLAYNGTYQDYLVPNGVPEPATMLLLGFGLIGLAGFGRKRLLKKA